MVTGSLIYYKQQALWHQIPAIENLQIAYLKARKGKKDRAEVQLFSKNTVANLYRLKEKLDNNTIDFSKYRVFTIYDPKERQIAASPFEIRIVQHAIFNVLHHAFERCQVSNSYASRPAKGMHAAVKFAANMIGQFDWFLKLDVRKYFETIPHEKLKINLAKLFNEEILISILFKIIDQSPAKIGLPIGNLSSQYFANHYLTSADYFFCDEIGTSGAYIRYMDDMVVLHNNKEFLKILLSRVQFLFENELILQLKPPILQPSYQGLPFLGHVLFPNRVSWNKQSKERFKSKMCTYGMMVEKDVISQKEYQLKCQSLFAFKQLLTH